MVRPPSPSADDSPGSALPGVSVIMPVRNEERHLEAAVSAVLAQAYAGPLQVVLAVGPSTDRTAEIATRLAAQDPRVLTVVNPSGRTPAALNRAVTAAEHDVLVRVDGHSELRDGYVADAVRVLLETGAANAGGMMHPVGQTPFETAVARAMSHPVGIGSERFHTGGDAGPAATVYLGVFRRQDLADVGGFDEEFVRAQDWELNHRLRSAGKLVWFDPTLAVTYRPRGSWRALTRQFYETGRWRRQVIRRYPATASPRYLAPPAAVLGVAGGALLSLLALLGRSRLATLGAVGPAGYGAIVLGGSALAGRGLPWRSRLWLPVVVASMHMAWGIGFLRGLGGEERPREVYPGSAQGSSATHEARRTAARDRPED